MAATATLSSEQLNVPRLQEVASIIGQIFSGGSSGKAPSSSLGATVNAQALAQRAGGLSEADRTMIAVVAGLKGGHAKAMDDQMQRAAELGAQAARAAGHKGALSEEQAKAISDQVMKGLEGKHLSAQVQEKTRLGKTKAAIIGTIGAASALTAGAVALAAKPLAWAADKVIGTKMTESFTVRGALTKGFLAVAVTFGAAAAYDMHKRNSRNNARDAALVHAIQHGAQRHAQGGFVTRAEAAAAAPKQEPALDQAQAKQQEQAQAVGGPASLSSAEKAKQMTTLMSTASSPIAGASAADTANLTSADKAKNMTALMGAAGATAAAASVVSPAPKPPVAATAATSADKAKNMTALMSGASSPAPAAHIPPAPKPPAAPLDRMEVLNNMMKAVAKAKPASISGGETVASGPVGPGKLPDAPAPKVEATRG